MKNNTLKIPCLKGKIGTDDDGWFYYTGLMSFKEIANRVQLPKEIDKNYLNNDLKLGEWIQRDLDNKKTKLLVEYINTQPQRFFNSLILGIFDGAPVWQELKISNPNDSVDFFSEDEAKYFSSTMGVLTLEGNEKIFAIDGQHRAVGIREAIKDNKEILNDEVSVVFLAHRMTIDGIERTRRLFTTLNRYAKPVDLSEIIILSEDDNSAIITRRIIDEFKLLENKILVNKSPSINVNNKESYTNIRTLYSTVLTLLTDKKIFNITVDGCNSDSFIKNRLSSTELEELYKKICTELDDYLNVIPAFKKFIKEGVVDRKSHNTNLIFRPIGQHIFFDLVKIAKKYDKLEDVLEYFKKDTFNLNNPVWRKILWDEESNNITTQKTRIRYSILLMLDFLNIKFVKTKKDQELFTDFGFDSKSVFK
ncbi:DGQHR domain-containing protein [Flavobacterium ardleyense]|uniref:DGQHR domain-containing protein n=1 Tax=Flavobacterium ardleyense TaxID=2038737 RepID=UPI00298D393E|nr:DNA sulfur modification protein DndB [Flavobacterium ardleyense]